MASYNKNPAALNEPDGIVAVWNLHMLERPEFVFHSQVLLRDVVPFLDESKLTCKGKNIVGRPLGLLFAVPPQPRLRRVLQRPDSVMGHPREAPPRAEDTSVGVGTYASRVHDADGRHAECAQPDYGEHGWDGVQLVGGYAGSAAGMIHQAATIVFANDRRHIGNAGPRQHDAQQDRRSGHHRA